MDGQQQVGPGCFGCGGTLAGLQVGAAVGGQQGRKAVIRRQFLAQRWAVHSVTSLSRTPSASLPQSSAPMLGLMPPCPGSMATTYCPGAAGWAVGSACTGVSAGAATAAARRWRAGGCRRTALSPRPRPPAAQPPHTAAAAPFWPGVCGGSGAAFPRGLPGSCGFGYHTDPPLAYRCIVQGGCYRVVSVL